MVFSGQVVIENVYPGDPCSTGLYKVTEGRDVQVGADIYTHGTEVLDARIRFRKVGEKGWRYHTMVKGDNDRWAGRLHVSKPGEYEYTVQAWVDRFTGQIRNIRKWSEAGEDISQDFMVIREVAVEIMKRATPDERSIVRSVLTLFEKGSVAKGLAAAESSEVSAIFRRHQKKYKLVTHIPSLRLQAVPSYGGFSSWYELFPRSQTDSKGRSGTFRDCERMLPYVRSLGFDVLYLTPIHPIGATNRRGKNGAMKAGKNDPGSPWAIGNAMGGHKSVNPDLGTIDDFRHLIAKARGMGIEIAMDIAFQCSPDHPYVTEHPQWFYHRPDGTIRYAENPPKKYYDIYPLNFDNPDWKGLWKELESVFLYWIKIGVRIFRVDNPHTKPFDFWETVLGNIRKEHPDVIFLAEAFTRPKVMSRLSRIGFTCSYSYFTWKNYDWEIKQYFREISEGDGAGHFRPVLFTNTPDILTEVLQTGGRGAFTMRAVLAATLSPMWGIYSGYEICENRAVSGTEEYLDSEKYEIKVRKLDQKGNIKGIISRLNEVRKSCEQLQEFAKIQFLDTTNPNIVSYMRWGSNQSDPLVIAVNINPSEKHESEIRLPLWQLGIPDDSSYRVRDLLGDVTYQWKGERNYVSLEPGDRCAHIFRIER